MTNEERDLIARFVSRVGGSPQQGGFLPGAAGSVPQSQAPLPPMDPEADQFIGQQFQQYPQARYRITQMAVVQEAALAESANRIRRLEWELEQARAAVQQAPQQSPQQKGFFGSLFGGSSQPQPRGPAPGGQPGYGGQGYGNQGYGGGFQPTSAPPQPQYPPNYQPGMFQQRGGSGFLGSALTTAAGVAGGMVVGNALMNAFSGHSSGYASSGMGSSFGSNASFDGSGYTAPTNDPTAGFGGAGGADPWGGGGATKADDGGFGQNTSDQGSDPFGGAGGSYDPGSFDNSGGGGGFDSGGGGFDGGGGGFDGGGSDNS